jgi:hypothetical protein
VNDVDVGQWVKDEAIKRQREVQEATERLQEEREKLLVLRQEREQDDDDPVGNLEGPGGEVPTDIVAFLREQLGATVKVEYTTESQALIAEVCDEFRDFLIAKNEQYGDSAIDPVRIFSQADPEEQLKVRMDDKLSRLMRGDDRLEPDDDIVKDLLGYWILLHVIRRKAARADA